MENLEKAQAIAGMSPLPDDAEELIDALAEASGELEATLIWMVAEAVFIARHAV